MTILEKDIQFVKSQVMADVPEGGGGPTGSVIFDGKSNDVFEDVSDLDRTLGAVKIRKIFARVDTPTVDKALGLTITCTQPQDPQISILLFTNKDVFDTRTQAADRVSSYTFYSGLWQANLYGLHPKGMAQVKLFQVPGTTLPPIGKTLYLVQNESNAQTRYSQYVQARKIESEIVTYRVQGKEYRAELVTITIGSRLKYDFTGSELSIDLTREPGAAIVRDTFVADAADCKGSTTLKEAVVAGSMTIKLNSIMAQLVPSSRLESQLNAMTPAGQATSLIAAGSGRVQQVATQVFSSANVVNVGGPWVPGTLTASTDAGILTDLGGDLKLGTSVVGTVKPAAGELTYTVGTVSGTKTIRYRPAAPVLQLADSAELPVTAENRRANYSITLPVDPNVTWVSYMAGGRWYTLRDDGSGVLRGSDSSYGTGMVNHSTRTVSISLVTMPDVGSSVLIYYTVTGEYIDMTPAAQQVVRASLVLPLPSIFDPAGLSVTWVDGGAHTANGSANGSISGTMAGGGTILGKIDLLAGELLLQPARLAPPGTSYSITSAPKGQSSAGNSLFVADSAGVATGSLGADVQPYSVELFADLTPTQIEIKSGSTTWRDPSKVRVRITDDGAGKLILRTGSMAGLEMGTVSYATGAATINTAVTTEFTFKQYEALLWSIGSGPITPTYSGNADKTVAGKCAVADGTAILARWIKQTAALAQQTITAVASELRIDLPVGPSGQLQPGSVRGTLGGVQLYDNLGQITLATPAGSRTYGA